MTLYDMLKPFSRVTFRDIYKADVVVHDSIGAVLSGVTDLMGV